MPLAIKAYLLSLLFLLIFTSDVSAQVVINEVDPASDPEWVELYNLGLPGVSLDGCILYMDDNHGIQNVPFTSADVFESNYKVVSKGDYSWSSNWLNNNGDEVSIVCTDSTDLVSYGNQSGSTVEAPDSGKTLGRTPDGTGSLSLLNSPTQGGQNSGPPPTPTNSPTPTTKSNFTSTPSNTPVPTLTNTPTPKPTVKVTKKPTNTPKITKNENQGENLTLGLRDELSITPTPDESAQPGEKGKFPWLAGLFILGGTGFIGAAFYPTIKKRYNLKSESKQKIS